MTDMAYEPAPREGKVETREWTIIVPSCDPGEHVEVTLPPSASRATPTVRKVPDA